MNTETLHNWTARYKDTPYYADLSAAARIAVKRAHDEHQSRGLDAKELAEQLIARFPDEFSATGN